jgi:eukaryotic-like serine/threonine-protein kinase
MSAPWPEELPQGFEFERYKIVDCVWRGIVASVYRAESAARGAVALKVFDRPRADRLQNFRQLSRNARAAAAVRHPNVAALLGVGVWQEHPYVVTEWLDGCDLEDYLDRWGVMSEDEVAELALHLISGLMALHEADAIHGDIKPSSIFLCNGTDGDVIPKLLLSDLPYFNGHASPVDSTTREIAVSTPAYLAPEAIRGRGGAGPTSDQYSLGAVLYECAVGQPPFVGETLLDLLKAVAIGNIEEPRALRPELSVQLEEAILRALSLAPEERFDTLRDFGRALWPLASERARSPWAPAFGSDGSSPPRQRRATRRAPVEVGPSAPSDPPPRSTKVPAALVLLAASVALSIGLGAVYFYASRGGTGGTGPRTAPVEPAASGSATGLRVRF